MLFVGACGFINRPVSIPSFSPLFIFIMGTCAGSTCALVRCGISASRDSVWAERCAITLDNSFSIVSACETAMGELGGVMYALIVFVMGCVIPAPRMDVVPLEIAVLNEVMYC